MSRYQNYRALKNQNLMSKTGNILTGEFQELIKGNGTTGNTWDAKHLTSFLSQSNYSNWKNDQKNISREQFFPNSTHGRSYSETKGDHFFKTTKDNQNSSKIGCTPIFPLVNNSPLKEHNQVPLKTFFKSNLTHKQARQVNGKSLKLQCQSNSPFKFDANALKFKSTDPLSMKYEDSEIQDVSGFKKERMNRLITKRHPHGLTGIDHAENPEGTFYGKFEDKVKVRQEPNTHRTFLIDRDWNSKRKSQPPVDQWKLRKTINIRQFRNDDVHGYNIISNRKSLV